MFATALNEGELITAISFPIPKRAAYMKFKQSASRFAMVGVCVSEGAAGVRVGVTGARSHAFRWSAAEAALAKSFAPAALDGLSIPAAGLNADLHAGADYRASLVATITRRAVAQAIAG